jgi:hypothetical protein
VSITVTLKCGLSSVVETMLDNKENILPSSNHIQHNPSVVLSTTRIPLGPVQVNLNIQKGLSFQKRKKPLIQRLGKKYKINKNVKEYFDNKLKQVYQDSLW